MRLDGLIQIGTHDSIDASGVIFYQVANKVLAAALEHCVERLPNESQAQSLSALTMMTMLLMQKYTKADGAIGIDDIDRWPVESDSVQFLSTTTSVATIEDLMEVSKF